MKSYLIAASLMWGLVGGVIHAGDFPKNSPKFFTSYAEAEKVVQETKKPRVVVFSASWCGPCQEMKKSVYPDSAIQVFHDRFEWVYVDVEENEELATKFRVNSIPRIDILSADGKLLGQQVGGGTVNEFSSFLIKGLSMSKK